MACKLVYNNEGQFVKALTPDGRESSLFKQILSIPHIRSVKEASELYANIFSKKMYSIMGEKGAQNLDKVQEVTFRMDNLRIAKEMEQEGKSPKQIKLATGWERSEVDNKFRYEILDGDFSNLNYERNQPHGTFTNGVGILPLSEIYQNKELFDAYPSIQSSSVVVYSTDNPVFDQATMFNFQNTIFINERKSITTNTKGLRTLTDQGRRVLLHELSHSVQNIEGFGRGDNPATMATRIKNALNEFKSEGKTVDEIEPNTVLSTLKNIGVDLSFGLDDFSIDYIAQNYSEDLYERVSGEVEANNVSKRFGMSLEERKNSLFSETQDVSTEDQVFLENNLGISSKVEPQLNFQSDKGNTFKTFKEALKDSTGGDMNILFDDQVVGVINSEQNLDTFGGIVNHLISSNILSENTIVENGKVYLKAEGFDPLKQLVNEDFLKEYFPLSKITRDGKVEILERVEPSIVREVFRTFSPSEPQLSEETLKDRMLNFLKEVGITVTSIENYVKAYKIRNGVEPGAEAISDFANQVIAFKDGEIEINNLSEETAHFIIENWDENEIRNLTRNIHKTQTFAEFYQKYYEIYQRENPEMPSEELDFFTRKEILGKELAKNLVDRFDTTNKEPNILRRIYELFAKFISSLTTQGNYKTQLENLTEKVEDLMFRKDGEAVFQLKNKKFRMYSLPQTNVIKAVAEQEKLLARTGQGSSKTAKEVLDSVSKVAEKATTDSVITLAKRQVKYVKEAVDAAVRRGRPLSTEESLVLNNLTHAIRPALEGLQAYIKNNKEYKKQTETLEKTLSEISLIAGSYKNAENDLVDQLLDRIIERNPQLVSKRDEIRAEIDIVRKDTNYIYSYFGQVSHASDPILQMLAVVGSDIYNESRINYNERQMAFNNKVKELGFTEIGVNQLVGEDGYVISKWNFEEFADFEKYARATAYLANIDDIISDLESRPLESQDNLAEHKAFKAMSQEEFLEKFEYFPAITNKILATRTMAQATEIINQGEETTLSDEEVKKRIENNKNLSDVTKATIRGFMETRAIIRKNMKTSSSGTKIYTLQNRHDMEYLNMERRKVMSLYKNEDSKEIKEGLTTTNIPISEENIYLEIEKQYLNLDRANASDEAIIAFEMLRQQKEFMVENSSRPSGVTDKFIQDLEDMEKDSEVTREDLENFVKLNASIGFSNSFFEGEYKSVFDKIGELDNLDDNALTSLNDYNTSLRERKAILNRYRDSNDSTNIMTHNMTQYDLDNIVMLEQNIESRRRELLKIAKDNSIEIEFSESKTVKSPNKSYYEELRNQNLEDFEDIYNFSLKHMTPNARLSVQNFYLSVKSGSISDKMESLVAQYGATDEGILQYAQSRMLPYYTSNSPQGLVDFYNNIRNSESPISQLVKELDSDADVRFSVAYDYADTTSDKALNKFKDADFRANTREPSLRKKVPKLFNREFNFKNKQWEKIASDNKLLQLHKLYLDFQEENLKGYGIENNYNIYQLPQVERASLDKLKGVTTNTKATFKEFVERATTHRVDEQDFGEDAEMFNAGIKVIPKKYLKKLNKDEVSKDLLYSSALLAQQVELYKARVKYFGEISALEQKLEARQFIGGKPVQSTNTYNMFRSSVDNMIFGIQETQQMRVSVPILGDVDLSKTLRSLQRYFSRLSLAFTPIVPITSMLTATTAYLGEPFIKQYVDPESYKKGSMLTKKWMEKSLTDTGTADVKSMAVAVGNHFGIFDLAQRYKNINYGRFVKEFVGNAEYGLHTLGNFLPLTQAVAVTLTSHRFSNDKLVTRKEFAGTDAEWSRLKSVADYVENSNGEMTYNSQMFLENGITPSQWKNLELGLMSRVGKIVERIDGQIKPQDRTMAQRNFLLSWVMIHKSWLAIGSANAFKGKQINMLTGQVEQGKYSGFFLNYVPKVIAQRFNIKSLQDKYGELDEADKVSARRVLVEQGVLTVLTILGFLVASGADDDEENYGKQLTNYLVLRTKNETVSSQLGIIGEMYKSFKEPVVGLGRATDIASFWNALDFSEVERGRYKGMTESGRYFLKAIPGLKTGYDLMDAKNIRTQANSYEFFNKENESWNVFATMLKKAEEIEEEE